MGKSWLLIVCFFALTQNIFSAINSNGVVPEILTDDHRNAGWHVHAQMPQLNVEDSNSVAHYLQAVQNDCIRPTWEESQMVLETYLGLAKPEFFKSVKATTNVTTSSERLANNLVELSRSADNESIVAHMTPHKEQLDRELLKLTLTECFYRRYLNALDIVALKIINKKQEAAALDALAR